MYVVVDDGGASVFTSNWPQPHETRVETDETMKLLLASATSLVTRVAWLKNCQAQRANQASDSSLPRGRQLPPPPSWIGLFMPAGSGSRPSSASSGAVEAECQQEAEAAHPAPARGRWKRNASMKWKPPIQRQSGIRLITADQHGVH